MEDGDAVEGRLPLSRLGARSDHNQLNEVLLKTPHLDGCELLSVADAIAAALWPVPDSHWPVARREPPGPPLRSADQHTADLTDHLFEQAYRCHKGRGAAAFGPNEGSDMGCVRKKDPTGMKKRMHMRPAIAVWPQPHAGHRMFN